MDKISFMTEDGTAVEFFVEEQTCIAGKTYLLVSDSMDEEANAYIMKDISDPDKIVTGILSVIRIIRERTAEKQRLKVP